MNISTILIGFFIATLLAALFHLWRDGGFWKLVLYLAFSWAGFWLGQYAFGTLGLSVMDLGSLHVGGGMLGSLIFLFLGHWLGQIDTQAGNKG